MSLFNKKIYLKTLLNSFTDIHNHILPGIDDGAASIEDSLQLIAKFSELGVKNFVATPHVMNDFYPNTPATISSALERLQAALLKNGNTEVRIKAAAEYMMDSSFLEVIEKNKLLPLHQDYILVEMSYFQPPINLYEILFQLQTKSYKPVLAHPERYSFYHSKELKKFHELKDRGCYLQLNMLSLVGHYGKNIQKVAFQLLDRNLIDFIGSDTHQLRHLEKLSEIKLPEKRIRQLEPIFKNTTETFRVS